MVEQKSSNRSSQPRASEDGFSMIEMMIAIVVITVGLVSIVAVSAYVSRVNTVSNNKNVLAVAAQDQVDRLRTAVWSRTTEDPTITVGGSVDCDCESETPPVSTSMAQPYSYDMANSHGYTYTLNPENPHHAVASNTPIGELNITWQVRQGANPDLRYVTIKVVQVNAPPNLRDGLTVSTIISRN